MVHHPRLARGFFQYNRTILFGGKLNERQRELVILRVAHRQRSEYEWGQHVKLALDAGVTRSEIQAVATGNSAFNGVDLLMLQATDELLVGGRIEPTTWDRLAADLSTKQLMELVFCVGGYMTLGMAFESFGLEPESDTEPLPPPLAN